MINYYSTVLAIFLECKNWVRIIISKCFHLPLSHIKLRNGSQFVTDQGRIGKADLSMFAEIWYHQFYNPPFFAIQPNDTVLDIGANNGYFSIFAAQHASLGKVYAFEPVPTLAQLIKKNAAINNLTNIKVVEVALGALEGNVDFYLSHLHNGCHSLYKRDSTDEMVNVQCTTLDHFMSVENISRIDFLKMDCEGAEYDILLSLPSHRVEAIVKISMEVHDSINDHTPQEIIDFLNKHQFIVSEKNGYLYALNKKFF